MKVLSLTEPCATLIKEKKKKVETRSWKTSYRGELYIHASLTKIPKSWKEDKEFMKLVENIPLNFGNIICKCNLVDCIYMTKEYVEEMKSKNYQEYICGEYKEGRYAWILENIQPLKQPIKVKGHLSIWNYEEEKEPLNNELIRYIENEIFPLYSRNEEGHGISHIKTVIRKSLELAKNYNVDINMVYTIAAYHDIGHYIDRKTHEIISAQIFMEDENIKGYFTEAQRITIKEAIEDHRASSTHEPRTIYGKIVSTADRTIIDVDNTIKRTYSYIKKNYVGLSEEEQIDRVYKHLTEKYGYNGYAKTYLEDKEFDEALQELRQALSNKEEFIERVKNVISKMN